MAVNERLKRAVDEIKLRDKLTQKTLAETLGISSVYLSQVINGHEAFSDKLSKLFSKYFKVFIPSDDAILENTESELVEKHGDEENLTMSDIVKTIHNLSEAAVMSAEASNRNSKSIEKMIEILSERKTSHSKSIITQM